MNDRILHARRVPWAAVIVFVAVSFALAWLVALPLWLGDGLAEPMSVFLLPIMMFTPAIAALVVTFLMRVPAPGRRARFLGLWPLRPAKRVIWLMVAGWLAPPLLVALGILLSAALGFVQLDLTFAAFAAELEKAVPAGMPLPPVQVIVFAQLAMIPVGGLFNGLFAFGEELGWRGWLLPALRPLGTWPALILSGVIWGLWHSPVILLGYNFGRTDITGVLFMVGGCVAWGILLGWLRLRSASVWPAVIAHGSLNAAAGMVMIFAAAQPDLALAGPLGVASWVVIAAVVLVLVSTGQFRRQPELADAPGRLLSTPRP
ncbi:CPBP family intramembrane glutamic endopeptidase [Microbacterium sp. Ag1]|uniref:CPBP family intramembrane glutamic endopeptidase n=1 Tax=Microbacterium sp. Ag1 TaxID=1643443 RepID=UPI0006293E3A|nr:type II CAAX endopeptidase family protein [Microbacterium sp. Ag1]KKX96366.1 metal-dependent membrane protease [Microbacterium sp. Ag1]